MTQGTLPQVETTDTANANRVAAKRLSVLFIAAYVAQGIAIQFGLIDQPLKFFMMKELHFSAAEVATYLSILMIPWVLKPFYGLVCDFVPIFGYRRKSYLILVNLATAVAYTVMAFAHSLPLILACLMVVAIGISASTAITVGLAVEGGREGGEAKNYFALQTMFYYGAIIVASVLGGWLCNELAPMASLHVAAMIAALPVFCVAMLTPFLLSESKTTLNRIDARATLASLMQVFRQRRFWLIALFILCWDFSPSFGVSLYFFEANSLGFAQKTIGQLAGWNAAGMVLGSLAYRFWLKNKSMTWQLNFAIAFGVFSTLAFILISTPFSAVVLELMRGGSNMLAILAIYALASEVCAERSEVSVMAILLAVRNLATDGATFVGGQLFTHVFNNHLNPLIVVAAATTALCLLLVPLLKRAE